MVEDTTVNMALCEIDTSKMYNMHNKCMVYDIV